MYGLWVLDVGLVSYFLGQLSLSPQQTQKYTQKSQDKPRGLVPRLGSPCVSPKP